MKFQRSGTYFTAISNEVRKVHLESFNTLSKRSFWLTLLDLVATAELKPAENVTKHDENMV